MATTTETRSSKQKKKNGKAERSTALAKAAPGLPAGSAISRERYQQLTKGAKRVYEPDVAAKDALVGKEFTIVGVRPNEGNFGAFVSVRAYTPDGTEIIFNDGSTGIFKQLIGVTPDEWLELDEDDRRTQLHEFVQLPLVVPGGLRKSEYEYTDESGKKKPASTYYLSGSEE